MSQTLSAVRPPVNHLHRVVAEIIDDADPQVYLFRTFAEGLAGICPYSRPPCCVLCDDPAFRIGIIYATGEQTGLPIGLCLAHDVRRRAVRLMIAEQIAQASRTNEETI